MKRGYDTINDMKIRHYLVFVAVLITVLLLGFSESTLAAKGVIKNIGASGSSTGIIVVSDLGITDVGTLPTSRGYFFKELGRGTKRLFTFDSMKKTELELRITNEKAAEALTVQETNPDDAEALTTALKNYTKAAERLQARLSKLKETSENFKMKELLEKLDEQTLKHAYLLNQLVEKWNTDPYVEDASGINPKGAKDNYPQGAADVAQKKIQEIIVIVVQKEKNIEQKAAKQITLAETMIKELKSELTEFAINEPGVSNKRAINTDKQTPKKDFGDRMKAGLETAGGMLANAKKAFAEGKFGEAFGQARAVEVHARNTLRILDGVLRADVGGLEDSGDKINGVAPKSGGMPIVPGTENAGEKTVPEPEKRVFPETNNVKFDKTNLILYN